MWFSYSRLSRGENVLDLGCGSGRDVYLLSQFVGEEGNVVGLDMTENQLKIANDNLSYHKEKFGLERNNVEFIKGNIEDLATINFSLKFI